MRKVLTLFLLVTGLVRGNVCAYKSKFTLPMGNLTRIDINAANLSHVKLGYIELQHKPTF